MKAIVRQQYGGAEQLIVQEIVDPEPKPGEILIEVKAFGINQAELYFRKGVWGEVAAVSGIECVGVVRSDPSGRLQAGQKVAAVVGGMGRSIPGSYAQFVCAPASNVASWESDLDWEHLAAIPESYMTAWSCLYGCLNLLAGQTLVIRGGTSALGQAALNIAVNAGASVIATSRKTDRFAGLKMLGAVGVLQETSHLSDAVRTLHPRGVDIVLDLIGNATLLDSLAMTRRGGRVCLAGFLGGHGAIAAFDPIFQIPSGVHLNTFASALVLGTPEFPLSEIPFQAIVDRVSAGVYQARPAHVFEFDDIQNAHRLLESGNANGKIVVTV